MTTRKRPGALVHEGRLTWASLFQILPQDLFARSPHTREDPYSLGWTVPRQRKYSVSFSGLLNATAEAAVSLAVVAAAYNGVAKKRVFTIKFAPTPDAWLKALRLNQLELDTWTESGSMWRDAMGCFAYPIRQHVLTAESDVLVLARRIASDVRLFSESGFAGAQAELLMSVERVAYEALLNVFQHAFGARMQRIAYTAITITPPPQLVSHPEMDALMTHVLKREQSVSQLLSPEELLWFRQGDQGMSLEIAIGDAGLGIPQTLWRDAVRKRRDFSEAWGGDPLDHNSRAIAHQGLCEYAFHHNSTSKEAADFQHLAARSNWRGLHRCLTQVEHLGGCIVLASGQGRAGYVFLDSRMHAISAPTVVRADLPGTLVLIRVPLNARQRPRLEGIQPTESAPLRITHIASDSEIANVNQVESLTQSVAMQAARPDGASRGVESDAARANAHGKAVLVYMPFREFDSAPELLSLLPAFPPNFVSIVLFAHVSSAVRAELRAYTSDTWSSTTHGTPRLLCIWDKDHGLSWEIAGEVPLPVSDQKLYQDLVSIGHAELSNEREETIEVARDLASTFSDFFILDEVTKTLSFRSAKPALAASDYSSALDRAFTAFRNSARAKEFITQCRDDEAIRSPTGRLFTRFMSVQKLLRSSSELAAAIRQRFAHVLSEIGAGAHTTLVTDSAASYFVATLLCAKDPNAPRIRPIASLAAELDLRSIVLFVDAMFRGETAKRIAKDLESLDGWTRTIIACLDLRRVPTPILLGSQYRVHSLIKHYFDPGEWREEAPPKKVYEVDAITHVPFPQVRQCEFTALGTTVASDHFLYATPDVLISGLHLIGGQLHTISIDTARLLQSYRQFAVHELVLQLIGLRNGLPKSFRTRQLVLFCRPQSRIYDVLEDVADELLRQRRAPDVFIASLISVPGSKKQLFPRFEDNVLNDIRAARRQSSLISNIKLKSYIGVYLDDASISGSSLQDFVAKATALATPPVALLCVVIVNRLSPRETRFLDACRALTPRAVSRHNPQRRAIPFRVGSLFRLQVKTADPSETGSTTNAVERMLSHEQYFDERLLKYAGFLRNRLHEAVTYRGAQSASRAVMQHPFYPISTPLTFVGARVARLRHLLALNEQNEGVISEILDAVTELTVAKEWGLLSMLALEPRLIADGPLAVECWPHIMDMCFDCLRTPTAATYKSDALAILCQRGEEVTRHFTDLLLLLSSDENLITQLASALLTRVLEDLIWHERLHRCLDAVEGKIDQHACDWLRTVLEVPEEVRKEYIVQHDLDALDRVHNLIAKTWIHVGLEAWQAFDSTIKQLGRAPRKLEQEELDLGYRCLEFASRVLISGLAGIQHLAAQRLTPSDRRTVRMAIITGSRVTKQLRSCLSISTDPPGIRENTPAIVQHWNELRAVTIKGAWLIRLLGSNEEVAANPSVIEDILPRLFAAPFGLMQELTARGSPIMDLTIDADEETFITGAVVVPVAKSIVTDVFRILLDNMVRYAAPGPRNCRFALEVEYGCTALVITLQNKRAIDPSHGTGAGLRLLQRHARRGRFEIAPPQTIGETFSTAIRFPVAYKVSVHIPGA